MRSGETDVVVEESLTHKIGGGQVRKELDKLWGIEGVLRFVIEEFSWKGVD